LEIPGARDIQLSVAMYVAEWGRGSGDCDFHDGQSAASVASAQQCFRQPCPAFMQSGIREQRPNWRSIGSRLQIDHLNFDHPLATQHMLPLLEGMLGRRLISSERNIFREDTEGADIDLLTFSGITALVETSSLPPLRFTFQRITSQNHSCKAPGTSGVDCCLH